MPELDIHVTRVNGQKTEKGDFFDEFAPLALEWCEPGFTYCWIDRDERVTSVRKRQGWAICNVKSDFIDKGCPEEKLPGTRSGTGELLFGDTILAKMPNELWSRRYAARIEKARAQHRKGVNTATDAGRAVAATLRSHNIDVGDSIVFPLSERDMR